MGHITFVHGIANKPDRETLLRQWQVALLDDGGVDLDHLGVSSSMVYWADLLYARPAPAAAAHEASAGELEQASDADDADMTWLADVDGDEVRFVEALAREVGLAAVAPTPDEGADPIRPGTPLEAVPLPAGLKRRLMRILLRDVHHYLFDAASRPRPGEEYRIRRDVRARAVEALRLGAERPGPHMVIAHSLGSVIAYDVLTAVPDAPRVDALVTIGSPLGISEVRQELAPPWTADHGWPTDRLDTGPWTNVYDRLDPVCGFRDRLIAGHFRADGRVRVADVEVRNEGSWKHAIGKYLGQEQLRERVLGVFE